MEPMNQSRSEDNMRADYEDRSKVIFYPELLPELFLSPKGSLPTKNRKANMSESQSAGSNRCMLV